MTKVKQRLGFLAFMLALYGTGFLSGYLQGLR